MVSEEELNKIILAKDSINTRKNTASTVKLFKSYLNSKTATDWHIELAFDQILHKS